MGKKASKEASEETVEENAVEEVEETTEEAPVEEETGASEMQSEPQRKMWTIKCAECGKDAEVPFEPTEGRPVYCRDCFMKHRKPRRNFGRRRF